MISRFKPYCNKSPPGLKLAINRSQIGRIITIARTMNRMVLPHSSRLAFFDLPDNFVCILFILLFKGTCQLQLNDIDNHDDNEKNHTNGTGVSHGPLLHALPV